MNSFDSPVTPKTLADPAPAAHATRSPRTLRSVLSVPHFVGTTATLRGAAHARTGLNNQDAAETRVVGTRACAVVADGCSSGRASEVGARLAARFLAETVPVLVGALETPAQVARASADGLERVFGDLLITMAATGGERVRLVSDLLLCTLVVGVVDGKRQRAFVFGLGDGVAQIGHARVVKDSGEENAPDYLAYRLLDQSALVGDVGTLEPTIWLAADTSADARVTVASDGATPLLCADGDDVPFEGLFADGRPFVNPSLLQKRLRAKRHHGVRFDDDVSIAAVQWRGAARPAGRAPCV